MYVSQVGLGVKPGALRQRPMKQAKRIAMNATLISRVLIGGSALFFGLTSCKQKEKVLDVDTPGGGIQVERDKKSGEVEIKIEDKK